MLLKYDDNLLKVDDFNEIKEGKTVAFIGSIYNDFYRTIVYKNRHYYLCSFKSYRSGSGAFEMRGGDLFVQPKEIETYEMLKQLSSISNPNIMEKYPDLNENNWQTYFELYNI